MRAAPQGALRPPQQKRRRHHRQTDENRARGTTRGARECCAQPQQFFPSPSALRRSMHGGVLATKVGYFGVKSANVLREQMGTKPAKVGRLAPCLLNRVRTPVFVDKLSTIVDNLSTKTRFWLFSQKGLRSAGGPKLLKWGLSGRGSNLLKSGRPLTSTTPPGSLPAHLKKIYYERVSCKCFFGIGRCTWFKLADDAHVWGDITAGLTASWTSSAGVPPKTLDFEQLGTRSRLECPRTRWRTR